MKLKKFLVMGRNRDRTVGDIKDLPLETSCLKEI